MATKMFDEYLILHPENGGIIQLCSLILVAIVKPFVKLARIFLLGVEKPIAFVRVANEQGWIVKPFVKLTRFFLHCVAKPMALVGFCVEFILNFLSENGGLTGLICRLVGGDGVIIPKRDTENFISAVGYFDCRLDLDHCAQKIIKAGSRYCTDLSMMASKLAYENEAVIRNVVTNRWKMHFVEFFSCWNHYLQKFSTHAFIFCDKPENAKLVVIAFRGTEPFDTIDWSTDIDITLYPVEQIGGIHAGFLEAMGLANRKDKRVAQCHLKLYKSDEWPENVPEDCPLLPPEDNENHVAYHAIGGWLEKLLEENKDANFIVTGHSLGGALAVLFPAILLLHDRKKLIEKMLAIYTFGQPRVGDEQFKNYMSRNINRPEPRYYRVVYCNDMVPRLPYDDKMFLFKHFGSCIYYNSCYIQKTLPEAPNRNFSAVYFILIRINAIWELIHSFLIGYIEGNDFSEGWFGIAFRCMGIIFPGISAHSPVNYVNAIRLGPPSFHPAVAKRVSEKSIQMGDEQYHHRQN